MTNAIAMQLLALSLYVFFMGFCFCDGFKLHILRKLVWFVIFCSISIYILKTRKEYDLAFILPIPSLLAIFLCGYEKRKSKKEVL